MPRAIFQALSKPSLAQLVAAAPGERRALAEARALAFRALGYAALAALLSVSAISIAVLCAIGDAIARG